MDASCDPLVRRPRLAPFLEGEGAFCPGPRWLHPTFGGVMRLCLVEDIATSGLEPLTLTRPVHDLLLGSTTLSSKLARAFGVGLGQQRCGCVIRAHLVAAQRHRDPHMVVNDRDWLARGPVV